MRWVGIGGWEIERIVLDRRQVLRVRHLGYLITYASSVDDVAKHVDLASLVEVTELRRRVPVERPRT